MQKASTKKESERLRSSTNRSAAVKQANQCERSRERHKRISESDLSEGVNTDGTLQDCFEAKTRYYSSTNVSMTLDDDDKAVERNIDTFCNVSPAKKSELRNRWIENGMQVGEPLRACASCGIRDYDANYCEVNVAELSKRFEFNEERQRIHEELAQGVCLMSSNGELMDEKTNLSPIASSFLSKSGKRMNLHTELVNAANETCDFCTACLQVLRHDAYAATNIEIFEDDAKQSKHEKTLKMLLAKSMSLAADFDYGVLTRIKELETPSLLEIALLSPNRLYSITVKTSSVKGQPGPKTLKGDVIVFLHDGPEEVVRLFGTIGDTMQQRVNWVKEGGNFRVICVDDQGDAENWLHDNAVLLARPHVVFNHLVIRKKLNDVLKNPDEGPEPQHENFEQDFVCPMKDLAELVFSNRRPITSNHAKAADILSQVRASDVAAVRPTDSGGALPSVSLVSSSDQLSADHPSLYFQSVQELLEFGHTDENHENSPEDEITYSNRSDRIISGTSRRSLEPKSEFENNGLTVMNLFWNIFPLKWHKPDAPKGTQVKLHLPFPSTFDVTNTCLSLTGEHKFGPLAATGSLSETQRKHLYFQFTTAASNDPILHHFLANQERRHSVLRATNRVQSASVEKFETLVNEPTFKERLEAARLDPKTADAKSLERQLSSLITQVGKLKPWGSHERSNIEPIMLAVKDRHGTPSIFYTVALDDVHGVLSLRLGFPSTQKNGFPSFAGETEEDHVEEMMIALRNGGTLHLDSGKVAVLSEGKLQRLAVQNPTATSRAYHREVEVMKRVLFGIDAKQKRTVPIFESKDTILSHTAEARAKNMTGGIFGQAFAVVAVHENNVRKAFHEHGLVWTSLSPELLAKIADNGELFAHAADAIESQISGEVGLEVHVIRSLQKVVNSKTTRARFSATRDEAINFSETASAVKEGLAAAAMNDHGVHLFGCHAGFSGKYGCRFCEPAGHPVNTTEFQQLNSATALPPAAILSGDGAGNPMWCGAVLGKSLDQGCTCSGQWPGIDDEAQEKRALAGRYTQILLTKPTPAPSFPTGEDKVRILF